MARGPRPAPQAELPPDEVIQEILLRLPPHPASLLRASLVCKLWRRLLREPDFTRRFRARHRHAPPLLGFFRPNSSFVPAGDPPDRVAIPPIYAHGGVQVIGCRHGRVLIGLESSRQLQICYQNYFSKDRYKNTRCTDGIVFPVPTIFPQVQPPPDYDLSHVHVSLLCDHGHESYHFRRVAVLIYRSGRMHAGVYPYSVAWFLGLPSLTVPQDLFSSLKPGVLVGNTMYWLSPQYSKIVVFHLDTDQLHLMDGLPTDSQGPFDFYRIVKAAGEEDGLGMAAVRGSCLHLFALVSTSSSSAESRAAKWSQYRAVELGTLPGLSPPVKAVEVTDEAVNTIFLEAMNGVFALQLATMEVHKVLSGVVLPAMIAYRSFDVTGSSRGDGRGEVDKLQSNIVPTICDGYCYAGIDGANDGALSALLLLELFL